MNHNANIGMGLGAKVAFMAGLAMMFLGNLVTPAAAETTLDVTAPTELVAGYPMTFQVEITADQATSGTIVVTLDGQEIYRQAAEAPGGSTKQFVFTVGATSWGSQVKVVYETTGARPSKTLTIREIGRDPLVGLLPSVAPLATGQSIELVNPGDRADVLPLEPEVLGYGAEALAPLSAIMMSAEDAKGLNDDQVVSLAAWVSSGGELFFGGSQADLPKLFTDVGKGNQDRLWLGEGYISVLGDRSKLGDLNGIFAGNKAFGPENDIWIEPSRVSKPLTKDAGLSVVNIGPIMIFLLVYAFVVGPGLWFWLRSTGRLPVYWLAVPVAALVATGGIWVVGKTSESGSTTSFASLVVDAQSVGSTHTSTMLISRSGGYAGVNLGDQRPSIVNLDFMNEMGSTFAAGRAEVAGATYGLDLPPSSAVVLNTQSHPALGGRAWTISADSMEGNVLTGTVTNNSPYPLKSVVVGLGDQANTIGDVGSGESAPFSVTVEAPRTDQDGFDVVSDQLERQSEDEPVNAGVYSMWRRSANLSDMTLVVVGWSDQVDSPVTTVDGVLVSKGRTGYLSTASVQTVASAEVLSVLPARGRSTYSTWFGGEFQALVDQPGSGASVVVAPAGDPAAEGVRNGDGADNGDETGNGDGDGAEIDSVEPGDTEGLDDLAEVPLDFRGFEDQMSGQYLFEVFPGAVYDGPLAIQLDGVFALDYWNGSKWLPAGLATENRDSYSGLWAVPSDGVIDGQVIVRYTSNWGVHAPRVLVPGPDESVAWTVGAKS